MFSVGVNMSVEVAGFEIAQAPAGTVTIGDSTILHGKENGKLNSEPELDKPIQFGSHDEVLAKGEGENIVEADLRKNVVDEWPAPKQIHYFYFVKYRLYEDPKLKAKIDHIEEDIRKISQKRYQIIEQIKAKWSDKAQLLSQWKPLNSERKQYSAVLNEKKKEMEPLQEALGQLRGGRGGLCSSVKELNELIRSMHHYIEHESIPLPEEKKLLKEIKMLEGTRPQVIANEAMSAKIQDSLGKREDIQEQVKAIGGNMYGVRKEYQAIKAQLKILEDRMKDIDDVTKALEAELAVVTEKRDQAQASRSILIKQREDANASFYAHRKLLTSARDLATKKDVKALEQLSNTEGEKFISLWSSNKAIRDDYERRILQSLDSRRLSRDGRIRNPDEKPLVEPPTPFPTETVVKANSKRPKEEPKPAQKNDSQPTQKTKEEAANKPTDSVISLDIEEEKMISKPKKAEISEEAAAKLKEKKRQEEIAKAKMAAERKKKKAEKDAAKAAIRAQKEAEKKLKEQERKAKKKAAASAPVVNPEEPTTEEADIAEPEKAANVNAEASAPVPLKKKETVRYRNRSKGGADSLPKVILKRKKATNYWVYAAPAAILVLMLIVLGYYYYYLH